MRLAKFLLPYLAAVGLVAGLSMLVPYLISGSYVATAPTPGAASGAGPKLPPMPKLPPGTIYVRNDGIGQVNAVLSDRNPRPTDGASFFGMPLTPDSASTVFHVRVVANAYMEAPGEAVVAVFKSGDDRAIKVVSQQVPGHGYARFDIAFDVTSDGKPFALDFRIGPGHPGWLVFNGPDYARRPANMPIPSLTITKEKGTEEKGTDEKG